MYMFWFQGPLEQCPVCGETSEAKFACCGKTNKAWAQGETAQLACSTCGFIAQGSINIEVIVNQSANNKDLADEIVINRRFGPKFPVDKLSEHKPEKTQSTPNPQGG
jgi:hypothetical protein